jgi:hypothetical protein
VVGLPEHHRELRSQRPERAKKRSSAWAGSFSFFMWVMYRLPLAAKTKAGGVVCCQRSAAAAVVSR